jgi:hypothetical protein
MGEGGFFAFFAAIGAIGVSLLVGPVGQAIARRIAGDKKDPKSGVSTGEMAAERVAQLEHRIEEMEERLDFAERMLAQAPEPRAIGPRTPV